MKRERVEAASSVKYRASPGDDRPMNPGARQVAPGRYVADVVTPARTLTVTVRGAGTPDTVRYVMPDAMAEYRFREADVTTLEAFANATGGALRPTADGLRQKPSERPPVRRPISSALLALALTLWFGDILARRVRLFE